MTGHTRWAVVKVRTRLQQGWLPWRTISQPWLWARFRKDEPAQLDVVVIAPDELEVLDEVLREEG